MIAVLCVTSFRMTALFPGLHGMLSAHLTAYAAEITPNEATPGETNPGETNPGKATPGEAGPGETNPGETNPGEATPGEAGPGETNPGETTPGEATPGEAGLGETNPGETTPGEATPSETTPSEATPSEFVPETENVEQVRYYSMVSVNHATYLDRNDIRQYRVYGTPYQGTTGWYPADTEYEPLKPMVMVATESEYMMSAPLEYELKSETEALQPEILKLFVDNNPEFANPQKTGLDTEYQMQWDGTYSTPYLSKDPDNLNVYQTFGAFALKRGAAGELPIYYIVYGRIINNEQEGEWQWFKFTAGTGTRYHFEVDAGSFQKTIYGAAEEGAQIAAPPVTAYTKPGNHTLQSENESWTFEYTAHFVRLTVYSKDDKQVKTQRMDYDDPAAEIADENKPSHSGYGLKYYYFPE